ncbi:MAG: CocE/NonD family hydrolase [Chitinophagales bacterium]|nr:CocE/NonD family hydrolase [Chitinophagales bacterium]
MKRFYLLFFTILFALNIKAQDFDITIPGSYNMSNDVPKNGTLDDLSDFSQRIEIPMKMPDSTILKTDVFLPIFQDSLAFEFDVPIINKKIKLTVIPKGFQYIRYDSLNGKPNPNPYQLPMVMSRTPYNKKDPTLGSAVAILGYVGLNQDMRGRYRSEGVYFPIYSDSWNKNAYHPEYCHILDRTPLDHPMNSNKHEDGYNTVEYIKSQLKRMYDLDGDGVKETEDLVYNGSIGMFGASALGYNQVQAAAAHRIDPTKPGMKSLFPIVGPLEFYKSTGFQNGVFREQLVTGWLRGQIVDTRDDLMDVDHDMFNDIHTSFDYGTRDKFEAANLAIDHFSTVNYLNKPSGAYPNAPGRIDMDGSRAMVDSTGESDKNGTYSRYTNMEVPTFHVGGWWDIFVDGTLETFNFQRSHMSPKYGNRDLIKVVMGPWSHQTIASTRNGDMEYPDNVTEITKINLSELEDGDLNIAAIAQSELLGWFRYTLNYNDYAKVGEPTIVIPEAKKFQKILDGIEVRFPSREFTMRHIDLINFIGGAAGLDKIPVEIRLLKTFVEQFDIDVPKMPPLIEGFSTDKLDKLNIANFKEVAPARFYVVGPSPKLDPENTGVGNYWFSADTFPIINDIHWESLYLRGGGRLSKNSPSVDEGYGTYIHDPDDPIFTVGGANMITQTPQGDRDSQCQMKLSDPLFAPFTMDREGILKFETNVLEDTLSIIGFPKARLFAKSNPAGASEGDPTDTDFMVRIVDVYPNGDEYFVQEGVVNARAREWARLYADDIEDDNAPYSNIESGKIYEYYFKFLPIGYTFGKGHKVKILLSSSNHPRYQANPNLPINPGEFFRRQPGDGKTYVYNGVEMTPRKAVQRVAFSPEYPSQLILPVYGKSKVVGIKERVAKLDWDAKIFPNPSNGKFNVYPTKSGQFVLNIFNTMGQQVLSTTFDNQLDIDLSRQAKGQYFIEIQEKNSPESKLTKAVSIY